MAINVSGEVYLINDIDRDVKVFANEKTAIEYAKELLRRDWKSHHTGCIDGEMVCFAPAIHFRLDRTVWDNTTTVIVEEVKAVDRGYPELIFSYDIERVELLDENYLQR